MSEQNSKARFGVFDAVIIVFLVACLIAAGFAFFFKRDKGENNVSEEQKQEYVISFKSYNLSKYHADLIKDGDVFYLSDNNEFGTVSGTPAQTPAESYVEKEDGTFVLSYAPSSDKDSVDRTKKDVSGTIVVKGVRDESTDGFLVVGDNFKITPGKTLFMHNETVTVQVTVVDIVE
jgi:hypothetical protein